MTINLSLQIIGNHDDLIHVFSTNFVVHNTHLVGTTTELYLTSGDQLSATFFASYGNHWSWSSLVGMLDDGIEPPTASV